MEPAQNSGTQDKPRVRSIPGDPMCQAVLPLVDWVKKQEEAQEIDCPPCDLATIAPWYRDLLDKKGYTELAARVQALAEGDHDTLEVAQVLDDVRESVPDEEVQRELTLYDCMMQKYEEEGG